MTKSEVLVTFSPRGSLHEHYGRGGGGGGGEPLELQNPDILFYIVNLSLKSLVAFDIRMPCHIWCNKQ